MTAPSPSLTARLQARVDLHRNMQDNLTAMLEGLLPDMPPDGQFAADTYELGARVGVIEALRFVVPRLAECVDGNPESDERLRLLLADLRSAVRDLAGEGLA